MATGGMIVDNGIPVDGLPQTGHAQAAPAHHKLSDGQMAEAASHFSKQKEAADS